MFFIMPSSDIGTANFCGYTLMYTAGLVLCYYASGYTKSKEKVKTIPTK